MSGILSVDELAIKQALENSPAILDLKRDETMLKLADAWFDEDGINLNVWATAATGIGSVARNTAEAGKIKVRASAPGAADTARLRSYDRFPYGASLMTGAHIIRKVVIEFEAKLAQVASILNTNFIMGFTPATGDNRSTADVLGFILNADALQSLTDNGGVETMNPIGAGLTLTNWNKYTIEISNGGVATVRFTVTDGSVINTQLHLTNLPTQSGFLQFYCVDDGGAAGALLDVGTVRVIPYDNLRA